MTPVPNFNLHCKNIQLTQVWDILLDIMRLGTNSFMAGQADLSTCIQATCVQVFSLGSVISLKKKKKLTSGKISMVAIYLRPLVASYTV